ncbi:Protein MIZU-KUSSEI like [Heracleum sosnowskyi]|uniref:Protein MIZU-KUSSEI like n=1 Tax=Heracleum sosnowskyi TaxID=360622 RepID=A0AAD8HDD3_9APIA|nr:Protein MIZU-KUSSEI like [Heracleum sosnowskyi]
MPKIHPLRRLFLPCFTATTVTKTTTSTTTKKRLSTSLRDDIIDNPNTQESQHDHDSNSSSETADQPITLIALPRQSKTMVIATILGQRHGHVWFCVQHDRLSTKPCLLLELSIPTHSLVKEMQCGLVRLALKCNSPVDAEFGSCPLHMVPVWTLFCNGKKFGFAVRRKATLEVRYILKIMQSMTVGAGVIPSGFGSRVGLDGSEELMYMRANYECVVGGPDSESFHLINPDDCPGQELSIFLMRSR